MSNTIAIQEIFGQFAVNLQNGPVLFKTEAEAKAALSEFENGAEMRDLAAAFCAHKASVSNEKAAKSYQDKAAVGKSNVIIDFLSWVDAGKPGVAEAVEEEAAEEDDADTGEF